MPARSSQNSVLAGLFVLICLALGIAIVITLSSLSQTLFTDQNTYIIQFDIADGAEGLSPGSPVKLGGQQVGTVKSWDFARDTDGYPTAIDVTVSIRADVQLYENAAPMLTVPLLGSASAVNIPYLGAPDSIDQYQGTSPALEDGEHLAGTIAPPAFLAQAGFGDAQRNQLQQIIKNITESTNRIDRISSDIETTLEPVLQNAASISADAAEISTAAKTNWNTWRTRIDETLTSAKQGLEQARTIITSVQDAVDTNRPKVDATIDNVAQLTDKLNTQTYDDFAQLIDRASSGVDSFASAAETTSTELTKYAPEIGLIAANARLASDQLKLLMVEARQSPWRLLYQPGKKELSNELLYNSVRTYASAVSDLRAASEQLRRLNAAGDNSVYSQEQIQQMIAQLQQTFDRYEQAEDQFFDNWLDRTPAPPPPSSP